VPPPNQNLEEAIMANKYILKSLGFAFGMVLLGAPAFADAAADAAACDVFAASKEDTQRPADVPGLAASEMDSAQAIVACDNAMSTNPENPRIAFQLARALYAASQNPELIFGLDYKSAQADYVVGMINLARDYDEGVGTAVDHKASAKLYLKAAGLPYAHRAAMYYLANAYRTGSGVDVELNKFGLISCKSAALGYVPAANNCGISFQEGYGWPKSMAKAVEWYRKSSDSGDPAGTVNLGILAETGNGVPKDQNYATSLFLQAADLGNFSGMNHFGKNLILGLGIPQDIGSGMDFLNKAVEGGDADGAASLAEVYERGTEAEYDAALVASNYLLAIKRGSAQAKATLITDQGMSLKPSSRDAIQSLLEAEFSGMTAEEGKFSSSIIAVLKIYK
jgi:TPR repeat protein